MPILGAAAVPHPPLILPEVGRGEEAAIQATIDAYQESMDFIAALKPETIIVISPHAALYADWFEISPGNQAKGSFAHFAAPEVGLQINYDSFLAAEIERLAQASGIPAGSSHRADPALDHGTMIPLLFLNKKYTSYNVVRIGISGLPLEEHYRLGKCIAEAAVIRRVAVIASGDLSHRLQPEGPYGFTPEGPRLDEKITHALASGDYREFLGIDPQLAEKGAECGLRSFVIMAGAMGTRPVEAKLLSYEGPFGVGYAVATWRPKAENPVVSQPEADPYIALARFSVESYVKTGSPALLPQNLPPELLQRRAGVFVTLHKFGALRGCIGTIVPTTQNIAEEILQNAVSAAACDPRFAPVTPEELASLQVGVDVLGAAEPVRFIEELDPRRYGVIVTSGGRRGLLLPALEGVDTAAQQVDIASQKAGIPPGSPLALERFEVVRHE